jgi:hypothetical protein
MWMLEMKIIYRMMMMLCWHAGMVVFSFRKNRLALSSYRLRSKLEWISQLAVGDELGARESLSYNPSAVTGWRKCYSQLSQQVITAVSRAERSAVCPTYLAYTPVLERCALAKVSMSQAHKSSITDIGQYLS